MFKYFFRVRTQPLVHVWRYSRSHRLESASLDGNTFGDKIQDLRIIVGLPNNVEMLGLKCCCSYTMKQTEHLMIEDIATRHAFINHFYSLIF